MPSVSAYEYQYNLKDHLGNNRVVFKLVGTTATLIQEGHYYPFGMEMEGFTTESNRYPYNSIAKSGNNGCIRIYLTTNPCSAIQVDQHLASWLQPRRLAD